VDLGFMLPVFENPKEFAELSKTKRKPQRVCRTQQDQRAITAYASLIPLKSWVKTIMLMFVGCLPTDLINITKVMKQEDLAVSVFGFGSVSGLVVK
jgi:hypothetical protein